MNFFKLTLAFLFLAFLGGCGSNPPKQEIVQQTKTVYVTIPDEFLAPCRPSQRPISNDAYLKLSLKDRETAMTDYNIMLLHDLKDCDNRAAKARKTNDAHKQESVQ